MNPFLFGLIAGYGIAMQVGAISILIVERGIRCGFASSWAAGGGAATADFLYAGVAVAAGTAVAGWVEPFSLQFRWLSAILLILIAVRGIWQGLRRESKPVDEQLACPMVKSYFTFLGLTIVNPLTIVYFVALVLGMSLPEASVWTVLWVVAGVAVSSFSWQTLLAVIGGTIGRQLPPAFQRGAVLLGNLVVVGMAVRILTQSPQ